jgi:Rrf2 family protein
MKISSKGEYGIRAMLYIAENSHTGPLTSHEIASHQGIPEAYLRQILALLSKDRLIHSHRGPQGGHVLARPATEISLGDILLSLEGHTSSVDDILCMPCSINPNYCAVREVFVKIEKSVEGILANATLDELANRQKKLSAQAEDNGLSQQP